LYLHFSNEFNISRKKINIFHCIGSIQGRKILVKFRKVTIE